MPIHPDACPGPCANQARRAWQQYDQDVIQHPHQLQLHADRWQATLDAWHAPLLYPVEPPPPAEPQPPTIAVPVANPAWCSSKCPAMIRNALYRLNELAPVIYADITGHRGAAITGPNGTKPLDPKDVIERLDEMYGDLATAASQWKEVRGHPDRPSPARGGEARQLVVGYLLEQLDSMLRNPGSVEFGLSVLRWEKRLVGLSRSEPVTRRSPISCPRCGEPQVRRRDDGYFECTTCGRLLNQQEHDDHFSAQADEHDHERQEVGA